MPEKTFKEVGFLKYLLRSCVGLCNVFSICPSVFLSAKWMYLVFHKVIRRIFQLRFIINESVLQTVFNHLSKMVSKFFGQNVSFYRG